MGKGKLTIGGKKRKLKSLKLDGVKRERRNLRYEGRKSGMGMREGGEQAGGDKD